MILWILKDKYHWTPEQVARLGYEQLMAALEDDPKHPSTGGWQEVHSQRQFQQLADQARERDGT